MECPPDRIAVAYVVLCLAALKALDVKSVTWTKITRAETDTRTGPKNGTRNSSNEKRKSARLPYCSGTSQLTSFSSDRLGLLFGVRHVHQVGVADPRQPMARSAHLLIHLVPAANGRVIVAVVHPTTIQQGGKTLGYGA